MRTSYNCYVRVIIIESFYICYMTTECHEVLLLYDEVMSISANKEYSFYFALFAWVESTSLVLLS